MACTTRAGASMRGRRDTHTVPSTKTAQSGQAQTCMMWGVRRPNGAHDTLYGILLSLHVSFGRGMGVGWGHQVFVANITTINEVRTLHVGVHGVDTGTAFV